MNSRETIRNSKQPIRWERCSIMQFLRVATLLSAFALPTHAAAQVVAWGDNSLGQTKVPEGLSNVVAIAGGIYHSLALRADGTIVAGVEGAWILQADLTNVVAIADGGGVSQALRANGTVVAWGHYFNGSATVPITVPAGLSNVVQIASGYSHNLALIGSFLWVAETPPHNEVVDSVGFVPKLISRVRICLSTPALPVVLAPSPA
jgi:hypothetical protein